MGREEKMEALRQYRRAREAPPTFDFTQGPPDVSGLEGAERLNVLRQYRQFVTQRDAVTGEAKSGVPYAGHSHAKKDESPRAPGTPRSVAPYLPLPNEPVDVSDAVPYVLAAAPYAAVVPEPSVEVPAVAAAPEAPVTAAGVESGAGGSLFTYFERPRTAQATRVNCNQESAAPEPPTPRTMAAKVTAEAVEGAAGVLSSVAALSNRGSAAWLDSETPRHTRQLMPREAGLTERRVFAPDIEVDESRAEATKQLAERLRVQRLEQEQTRQEAQLAAVNAATTAGVQTPLDVHASADQLGQADAQAGVAPLAVPPPAADMIMAPTTVGMSRAAILDARKAWRAQMRGSGAPPPTPVAASPAGMSSNFRTRSVRGAVAKHDHESAADYNLGVKLGELTPRGSSVPPWGESMPLGASDAHNRPETAPAAGSCELPASAMLHGAPPTAGLSPTSHAEKLRLMREMRHGIPTPRD